MGYTYIDLDNLRHARSGRSHDSLDVVAAGLGQDIDAALDQVARGISGDLAGDEDLAIGADSLRLFYASVPCLLHLSWCDGVDIRV